MISRICDEATSPEAAYERAYNLCVQAVTFEKISEVYIGPALNSLTTKGQFGSWLRKLFHREKVTIHLHYYERLIRIVEQQARLERVRSEHIEMAIRAARGTSDAVDAGNFGMGSGTPRAPTETSRT